MGRRFRDISTDFGGQYVLASAVTARVRRGIYFDPTADVKDWTKKRWSIGSLLVAMLS
jgi:hypothetical protein